MTANRIQAAIAALAMTLTLGACGLMPPVSPDYPAPRVSQWLAQGWSPATQKTYHQMDQGTLTFAIPYEWFAALEQPNLLAEAPLFRDKAYLDRFGFIPGDGDLPVGFAASAEYRDPTNGTTWNNPADKKPFHGIGLTCAACHTGRLTFQGTELLIEGGSALIDLGSFRKALGLSIAYTDLNPARFDRFATRVLSGGDSAQTRTELRGQMTAMLSVGKRELPLIARNASRNVVEGFGRLDAINRIGNQMFALDLGIDENYAPITAPVHFPHIWTAPWYSWVQFNGSIMQPMVRNVGESLGVRALVNLKNPGKTQYDSTVRVENLHWIENALAGQHPLKGQKFTGLVAPKWPVAFPPIDQARAARGAVLYQEMCQGCHLPEPGSQAFWASNRWRQIDKKGERYLDLVQVPVAEIGTDPEQTLGMAMRTVILPPDLPLKSTMFGLALGEVVENVTNYWYRANGVTPAKRDQMNGSRPNLLQVPLEYKARTLDGIWAVAPYLHNGSVPTLYDLLSPREERPATVYLGDREYDPIKVGYRNVDIKGGFAMDTSQRGNMNTGHEFRNSPRGGGVIGRGLSVEERRALVEYLKRL